MITFGQTVRCATGEALAPASEAGATAVICPPDLADAALEAGLVPLVESPVAIDGRTHTALVIPVEGGEPVPSTVTLTAGAGGGGAGPPPRGGRPPPPRAGRGGAPRPPPWPGTRWYR
jgi:hypothetical protein